MVCLLRKGNTSEYLSTFLKTIITFSEQFVSLAISYDLYTSCKKRRILGHAKCLSIKRKQAKINWHIFNVVVPYSPLEGGTDVVFLVDSSEGVTEADYRREKEFVKLLSSHFNIHPSGARGMVISYSDQPSTVVRFNDRDFNEKLKRAPLMGTPRRTDRALELTSRVLSTSKPNVRKILVLILAGPQAPGSKSFGEYAAPLRKLGTQTFVVVIGQRPSDRDLLPLVDRPQDIVRVSAFDRLLSKSQQISKQIREKPG